MNQGQSDKVNKKISVMIVEDHPMFCEALANAIKVEGGYHICAQVRDGKRAVEEARRLMPDVIVMDINLPVMNGIEAMRVILRGNPKARILAITSATDEAMMIEAVQAGAKGYMLKDASQQDFINALAFVARGEQYLSPAVGSMMMSAVRKLNQGECEKKSGEELLTQREREVLMVIGEGLSNKDIAEKLVISESTVRVHITSILFKLNLENRNQAIIYSLRYLQGSESD